MNRADVLFSIMRWLELVVLRVYEISDYLSDLLLFSGGFECNLPDAYSCTSTHFLW